MAARGQQSLVSGQMGLALRCGGREAAEPGDHWDMRERGLPLCSAEVLIQSRLVGMQGYALVKVPFKSHVHLLAAV